MSTEIHLRQGVLSSALLTSGLDNPLLGCAVHCRVLSSISGLYLLDASCDNQQCLQTFPSVPWLRTTGLDYLENGCWGTYCQTTLCRGSLPMPLVSLAGSAEMNTRLQNKRPLWKLVLHYLRVTSGKALDWTLWITLPPNPRLCRGFLNSKWSTM